LPDVLITIVVDFARTIVDR